jgi:hypothetical protein
MHLATKPGAGTPGLLETDLGRIRDDTTETFTSSQRRAAARIAEQFCLTMSVALVVVAASGLGSAQ